MNAQPSPLFIWFGKRKKSVIMYAENVGIGNIIFTVIISPLRKTPFLENLNLSIAKRPAKYIAVETRSISKRCETKKARRVHSPAGFVSVRIGLFNSLRLRFRLPESPRQRPAGFPRSAFRCTLAGSRLYPTPFLPLPARFRSWFQCPSM